MAENETSLLTQIPAGAVLQATQIGQPIQLPQSTNGDNVIAVTLPDGSVQQFQLQIPPQNE